ncbi:hypothetical protein L2E82_34784 [Cichorium intybus]|uniref:Uncharacterized protein n=1 Tax=Cichorium intybus TaxID=13427 RepID=A0ACB9BMR2_CICIN|nr:hypothetical protein L2E82_34784 [Cichorium intybus]
MAYAITRINVNEVFLIDQLIRSKDSFHNFRRKPIAPNHNFKRHQAKRSVAEDFRPQRNLVPQLTGVLASEEEMVQAFMGRGI